MNAVRPSFAKGVRLRVQPDGGALLLVPEGALTLNDSAAAVLELIDGERTATDIAALLVERFDVSPEQAQSDVDDLLARLAQRQFIDL